MTSLLFLLLISCSSDKKDDPRPVSDDLEALPKDTGGQHIAQVLGSTSAEFGYYVYLPGGYNDVANKYPLLIFLHGKGERGDGSSSQSVLDKVLVNGPPKLIKNKQWDPTYPMIVVSPQFHIDEGNLNNWGGGDPAYLKKFIEFLIDKYRVNTSRIYLTGLSHGGNGVYDYLSKLSDSENYLAAAAPVAAWGANTGFDKCKNTPIWVFIGDQDGMNFTTSKEFVTKYNAQSPAPANKAKITVFKNAGHDVWTRTYSGEGIGTADASFDPFNKTLYDWMLEFERPQE